MRIDRKSTRLNSSHPSNSYAVFCLKKKIALTLLTNSEGGPNLLDQLFTDDWALRRFAGISNLPAVPRALSLAQLAPYEGTYTVQSIGPAGDLETGQFELTAENGQLVATVDGAPAGRLAFYRPDFFFYCCGDRQDLHSFPTRRSSD